MKRLLDRFFTYLLTLINLEEKLVATNQDLSNAVAAVAAQLTTLSTDVETALTNSAAALATAQAAEAAATANAVTDADITAVQALGTQVAALDAVVNPPAPAAPTEPAAS